ncbi:predicted protein [Lichtheimia corymbifera JMRC:FSU:9682]|uniref:Uncharacterized protein n=1 Tax=Lichtheimia corymbifera JMRC:FSU:9682 TaxID=1263082 RepID=A0A068SDF8_9FUNG|nr:predicted protein [Lichtheimia corymbifera JMRC:FSU:9682]
MSLEEDQRRRPPRAVNIIRPSSPLLQAFHRPVMQFHQQPSACSMTSASTWSSSSSSASTEYSPSTAGFITTRPTSPSWYHRPGSPSGWSFVGKPSPLGPLSRMAALAHQQEAGLSGLSSPVTEDSDGTLDSDEDDYDHDNLDIDLDDDDLDDDDDLEDDDLDDFSSSSSAEEDVIPRPIIAKMKQGCTIMNGKGELVGFSSNHNNDASDKFGRKIADLEIEVKSLASVNATLEEQTREQAARIAELEKKLQDRNGCELPPTPVSMTFSEPEDDPETEQLYERIKAMLQSLIDDAQRAVATQSKRSGRVLYKDPRQLMDYERSSSSIRTPPPPAPGPSSRSPRRPRSGSRNYSVVSCPEATLTSSPNRRSWPTVTAGGSRLLRMATQPSGASGRQRSQSMVRATSSP